MKHGETTEGGFTEFRMQDHLKNPGEINEYVHQVCEDGDASEFARCLRHVALAKSAHAQNS